jgi:phosphonate dehydrogenase
VPLSPDQEDALRLWQVAREELLRQSDFVLLGLPLAPETLGLVDARFLAGLKRRAFLANIARGSLVDDAAVADALEGGVLGGYAADVFAFEDWAIGGLRDGRGTRRCSPRVSARRSTTSAATSPCKRRLQGRVPAGAVNRPSSAPRLSVP